MNQGAIDAVEEAAGLYQRKGNLAAIAPSADDSTPILRTFREARSSWRGPFHSERPLASATWFSGSLIRPRTIVPRAGSLATSSVPPIASRRSAIPCKPVP